MITKKYYKLIRVSHEDSAYMRLKNISNEAGIFKMVKTGSPTAPNLEYSLDGATWTTYDFTTLPEVTVASGANIYFRGTNTAGFNRPGSYNYQSSYFSFNMNVSHSVAGNILSICYGSDWSTATSIPTVLNLFENDTNLIYSDGLVIGSSTANQTTSQGFQRLFKNCVNMITTPDISYITTANGDVNGYWNSGWLEMFSGCESITSIDLSNITTVQPRSMNSVFNNCYKLTSIKTPNISTWDFSTFSSWLQNAGSSATGTKTVYIPNSLTVGTGTGEIPLNSSSGIPSGWAYDTY